MRHLLVALTASSMVFLSGCATMFGDNSKIVHVNSVPKNAQIFANNVPVGLTPTTISVPNTWSPTLLTFRKQGYADQATQVNTNFQMIGLLNILFWPGFVIDAISGDMMKISPESRNIDVKLSPAV